MARTLLATAEPLLSGSTLNDAGELSSVDMLTGQASLEALLASGAKYSSARIACGTGKASLTPVFLGGVAKLLQPGASVVVQVAAGGASQVRCFSCHRAWKRKLSWGCLLMLLQQPL